MAACAVFWASRPGIGCHLRCVAASPSPPPQWTIWAASRWFGPAVTEPVRLHVAAKRFLVSIEHDYAAKLSAASVHTLRLQGGDVADEIRRFESLPTFRCSGAPPLDEAAKDASKSPAVG
jgi:hypothetical protein